MPGLTNNEVVGVLVCQFMRMGKVSELLPDNKAKVCWSEPREPLDPGFCDECGSMVLSLSVASGEILCMATGCGYSHGFDEKEAEFPIDQIIQVGVNSI